jgi:hypothetical protein
MRPFSALSFMLSIYMLHMSFTSLMKTRFSSASAEKTRAQMGRGQLFDFGVPLQKVDQNQPAAIFSLLGNIVGD